MNCSNESNIDKYLIYALVDPRNGEIRYVGKSCSGLARPKSHFYPCNYEKVKMPVYNWIKKLIRLNLIPSIEILETSEEEILSCTEIYYIAIIKKEGHRLLNVTMGGEGACGRKVSQEVKDRLSVLYKGRKIAEQQKLKISLSNLGRKHTEEQKIKASENSTKRKQIICVETNIVYDGIRRAARANGFDHRGIGRCCSGEYKTYKGFTWKYI